MGTNNDLLRELDNAPECEIVGVVSPNGIGRVGSGVPGLAFFWTINIPLVAWKPVGSELQKFELRLIKPVQEEEIYSGWGDIEAYDIIRVKARIREESGNTFPQALLIEVVGKDDSDSELNSYASYLQEEVSFDDPLFGRFLLNRQLGWFEATHDWCGESIRLTIEAEIPNAVEDLLTIAKELWIAEKDWGQRVLSCASENLLSLKNEHWLEDDESELDRSDFTERLTLESISIESDGAFEFWFDDGEIFCGHSIMVSGNLAEGPKDAGIHG